MHHTIKIVTDDGTSLHVYELPPAAASMLFLTIVPLLAAPDDPALLSERLIGHVERTPDGYVVHSATDDGVLYARDLCRAVCSALGITA